MSDKESQGGIPSSHVQDDADLARLGYTSQFRRDFNLFTALGVAFSVIGLLPSVASVMLYSLGYPGPVGLTWGWLAASLLISTLGLSMAEIASSLPTAGGLYYAAAALAPKGYGPILSWITGWSNMLGQFTTGPSIDWALASMITSTATAYHPTYVAKNWHTFLMYAAIILTQALIVSVRSKTLSRVNAFGAGLNAIIIFVFVIVLPAASINRPRFQPNKQVWTAWANGTEWPDGFAFLQSFLAVIYCLAGFDAPFHLSEETANAARDIPRAIATTVGLGGVLGFAINLVIAYTIVDPSAVLSSNVGQPMITFLVQVLGDDGALAIFTLIMLATFFVGIGCFTACSRLAFAFSRDGAIPFSRHWSHVNTRTQTPVNAVILTATIGLLLGLLSFAGAITINALFSICGIAQYFAFILPVGIKLFAGPAHFRRGPWHLGRYSTPINAIAVAFVSVIIPIICFPAVKGADLTPQTMNWSSLLWGGSMFLILIWWAIDARKWFKGPRVSPEHLAYATGRHDLASELPIESDKLAHGEDVH